MKIHVLGICGTFMGGLALLARELGHQVSGADQGIYPPMSEQLAQAGIDLVPHFEASQLDAEFDEVVIGNAMTRGIPVVERLLDEKRALISGPQWLQRHVLGPRRVLAVAGTHGKTSTASMLAWILERAGRAPGFLIGGVPPNFGASARRGSGPFVVEADEYDSAFFDKRSKFVHYRPDVLVLNNLEYDHADIFRDLHDIQRQFHHLVRTLAGSASIVVRAGDRALEEVLAMGCWTPTQRFGFEGDEDADWRVDAECPDASAYRITAPDGRSARVAWRLIGRHNAVNALAAVAAAHAVGVDVGASAQALASFRAPRRRLELRGEVRGVRVYDDFAHHPTAIAAVLDALRATVGEARILAVLDPASNTMRMGAHRDTLAPALAAADRVLLHRPARVQFDLGAVAAECRARATLHDDVDDIVATLCREAVAGDHVLVMSNAGFGGIHPKLLTALEAS